MKIVFSLPLFCCLQFPLFSSPIDSIPHHNRRINPYFDANFGPVQPNAHASFGLAGKYFGLGMAISGGEQKDDFSSFIGMGIEGRATFDRFVLTAENGIAWPGTGGGSEITDGKRVPYFRTSCSVRFLKVANFGFTYQRTGEFETLSGSHYYGYTEKKQIISTTGFFLGISLPVFQRTKKR